MEDMRNEKKTVVKDMTSGTPGKLIFSFALPLMVGNVFQQLYTFVDTMIVGQVLGVDALAALGATEWMVFLMFGFIQGLVQGFSVIVSQRFGANDGVGLCKAVKGAGYLAGAGAVIFTALAQLMVLPVLTMLRTPSEIIELSALYLRIIYAGVPVAMAYNLFSAILRALGNSKTPLRAMTAASLCNIILDVIFVYDCNWGIAGAAWATVLAQVMASLICLWELRKIDLLHKQVKDNSIDREILLEELKMGVPMGLQNIITAIGGLVVQSVINGFGVLFIAGYTAANKLYGLLEIAASSYGYAMSTYAGQNMGAGLYARIRKGLTSANLIGTATAFLMSMVMVLFGKVILSCFITGDEATVQTAIHIGYRFLLVLSCFFPLLYILYIVRACIQGMGNSLFPMISSFVQLIMRCGCALLLTKFIGETGIFWGEIMAWIGADMFLLCSYYHIIKCHIFQKSGC